MPKKNTSFLLVLVLVFVGFVVWSFFAKQDSHTNTAQAQKTEQTPKPKQAQKPEPISVQMIVRDASEIPNTKEGEQIRHGMDLVVNTYKYIGPEVADESKRYAGNNNACQNCHLDAGQKPFASPFSGLSHSFPEYSSREDHMRDLTMRVNGCMERSLNGKKLPTDSPEMLAILAYINWLSEPYPKNAKIIGRGLKSIDKEVYLNNKADLENGQVVFATHCAVCHGENGEGVKNGLAEGYSFPQLWGDDTYNDGAGMYRLLKASAFIKNNMPLGVSHDDPILTDKEAYDVAAFMNSYQHKRPEKANRKSDFPNLKVKPIDVDLGPYLDNESEETHKYGPYKTIVEVKNQHKNKK